MHVRPVTGTNHEKGQRYTVVNMGDDADYDQRRPYSSGGQSFFGPSCTSALHALALVHGQASASP
jgi:hypothetical protein